MNYSQIYFRLQNWYLWSISAWAYIQVPVNCVTDNYTQWIIWASVARRAESCCARNKLASASLPRLSEKREAQHRLGNWWVSNNRASECCPVVVKLGLNLTTKPDSRAVREVEWDYRHYLEESQHRYRRCEWRALRRRIRRPEDWSKRPEIDQHQPFGLYQQDTRAWIYTPESIQKNKNTPLSRIFCLFWAFCP